MEDSIAAATHCIRLAVPADFPALRFADPLMRADRDREHLIRTSIERAECFVVVDGDDVQGFVLLNYALFGHAFIPLLVIAASDRRGGLATALLEEAERQCVASKIFISCNRSNLPAQYLFEKCGFVPSGHLENLDDEDDELVFYKSLPTKQQR
jgi:ribosomal protein S18 acetylase RimI-like enzyme